MTNGESLRAKANPGLALWLANRIRCEFCPAKPRCLANDKYNISCAQMLFQWLESEEHDWTQEPGRKEKAKETMKYSDLEPLVNLFKE